MTSGVLQMYIICWHLEYSICTWYVDIWSTPYGNYMLTSGVLHMYIFCWHLEYSRCQFWSQQSQKISLSFHVFHNFVGIQKRSRDMGERGFYGDTFSDGFGAFKTMRKRQQHSNLRGKKVFTDLSVTGIDPVEVCFFFLLSLIF